MFRENLIIKTDNKNISLNNNWTTKIKGLVKTTFFDKNDKNNGYVVYYSEIEQSYFVVKFNILNGNIIFEKKVTNGSYGTGAIYKNLIVSFKEFKDIVAFEKNSGDFVWEVNTNSRIRSSINIIDDYIIFSSGENVYFINGNGEIIHIVKIKNSFLYGTISKIKDKFYVLGTKFDEEYNNSCQYIFCFDLNKVEEKRIGVSEIISSDTSGFWVSNESILIGCNNEIVLLDKNLNIIWRKAVEGIVSRHVVVSDDYNIYYTTLKGTIGSLSIKDGKENWKISVQEGLIFSPPSIYGDTLFILADGKIYLINKNNGNVYFDKVTGHSPYSAPIIFENKIFIGGGEPPINGALISYNINNKSINYNNDNLILKQTELGNYIENDKMQISIIFREDIENIQLDVSVISLENIITPLEVRGKNNIFEFKLKPNNVKGLYSLPISFRKNGEIITEMILVNLFSKEGKPTKVKLNKYYQELKQENEFYSGAAISQFILEKFDKKINQKDFREIINYVKDKSKWKDSDFQTWRLILKRVLTNSAKNIEEFLKNEEE